MMMSAPKARATDTGTGLTRPPSINQPSAASCIAGLRMPGMAMEARTARPIGPFCSQTSLPVRKSVATAAYRVAKLSMSPLIPSSLRRFSMCLPSIRPPVERRTSNIAAT